MPMLSHVPGQEYVKKKVYKGVISSKAYFIL
jgi:hypothetical protein